MAATLDAKRFPILAVLYEDELALLAHHASSMAAAANVAVISEGQPQPVLYLVQDGMLRVSKRHNDRIFEVGAITPGEVFGEAAIVFDAPASAEVRTLQPTSLLRLPGTEVKQVMAENERFRRSLEQLAERRSAASAIAVNPLFSVLPLAVRETLLYNADFVLLAPGEELFHEGGSDTRYIYLVLRGEAEASMQHPQHKEQRIILARIGPGDELGEIPLITGRGHAATVAAITPLRLLRVGVDSVRAWRQRYWDFDNALSNQVQRKLEHDIEVLRASPGT